MVSKKLFTSCFHTKRPEAPQCGKITSPVVVRWPQYLFTSFGMADEVVTENGLQFTCTGLQNFCHFKDASFTYSETN